MSYVNDIEIVDKKKKNKSSRINKEIYANDEEEQTNRYYRRLMKDPTKFYFYYEKIEGPQDPHDLRLQLRKIIFALYKGKKVSDIPEEFELTLKGTKNKYLVVFENKNQHKDSTPFSIFKFEWIKGIDEQEYGIFDN